MSATDSWEFFCVVLNKEGLVLESLIPVVVSPESTVSQLVREVQKFVVFEGYPRLWKPVTSISTLLRKDETQALVSKLSFQKSDEPSRKDNDAIPLNPSQDISVYWQSKPESKCVHVILRDHVQQQITSIKRPRAEEEDEANVNVKRLKRAIRKAGPSSLAFPANFQKIAGGKQPVITLNRPFDPDTIPLALFDPAFGIFRDRCKKAPSDRALACLYELSVAGCQWYREETLRRDAITPVLLEYLGLELHAEKVENTEYTTDGNLSVEVMPALIRECKNEIGFGINKAIAYYSNCLVNALQNYSKYNTRFPCILIVDMGTQLGFYGAVWDGICVRAEPLTRGLDLTTPSKEKRDRYEMASVLDASMEAVKYIQEHYKSIIEQKICRKYPFLSSYRHDVEQKDVGFIYDEQLHEDKLLFSATTDTNESIVVKFTSRYSVDAHQHMAQLELAPKIRQSISISTDWLAIVMDLSNYTSLYELGPQLSKIQWVKVQSRVRDIVQELHRGCFVHGDIRDTNILVDSTSLADDVVRVHLIDFDWAGRVGEARYPYGLNYETVKRPEGVTSGGLITVQHDIDMVSYLFQR